jgi:hypothetical protein
MFTVTVLPLQMVVVAGVTTGVVNGNALIVTATAFDTDEAQPLTVLITV